MTFFREHEHEIEWRLHTLSHFSLCEPEALKPRHAELLFWINIKYASNHIKCKCADMLLICECGLLQWPTDLQQAHVRVSILNLCENLNGPLCPPMLRLSYESDRMSCFRRLGGFMCCVLIDIFIFSVRTHKLPDYRRK